MTSMNPRQFLREYSFQLAKDFDLDGAEATWAPGVAGPRFWGEEDASIDFADADTSNADDLEANKNGNVFTSSFTRRQRLSAACSPDEKYLAISVGNLVRVYDIETRALTSEVRGHKEPIEQLHFGIYKPRSVAGDTHPNGQLYDPERVKYLLLLQGKEQADGSGESIVIWPVDAQGCCHDDSSPLPVDALIDKAMATISPDLLAHPGISTVEVDQIRARFSAILNRIDLQTRQKHRTVIHGKFPYNSEPMTHDGQKLLYICHGDTTQHGMRPADELPQIVVWNIGDASEICRLKGHTDAIMWAGWAADGQTVVTASWDQMFKIWDAETGECRHTIGPTNGQNWAGCLSPDGQSVLLSGGRPVQVAVYMIATGTKTANLVSERLSGRHDWIRTLAWAPSVDTVVMDSGQALLAMDAESGASRVLIEHERQGSIIDHYARFSGVSWAAGGRLLVAVGADRTIHVWDKQRNCKWRFQRPQGLELEGSIREAYYIAQLDTVVSVDGDRKVRYWKL